MNQANHNEPIQDQQEEALRRFVGGIGEPVQNQELICSNCAHLWEDETAECEVYEQKPLSVLRGENHCSEFLPDSDPGEDC